MSMKQKRLPRGKSGSKAKLFRFQTHSNPLSDQPWAYPARPAAMDWHALFPHATPAQLARGVRHLDVGCGFGGLLVRLGALFPHDLALGVEIRRPVVQFVHERIERERVGAPATLRNVAPLATNAMKLLPHFFTRGQLDSMFFLFPDPHFKRRKHKRRIITPQLLGTYAFLLRVGGTLYTITDVKDLGDWMQTHLDACPLFERISDEAELAADPCVRMIQTSSEEAKKVDKASGAKYMAVYRRIEAPSDDELDRREAAGKRAASDAAPTSDTAASSSTADAANAKKRKQDE